jgi:hypothetical protein
MLCPSPFKTMPPSWDHAAWPNANQHLNLQASSSQSDYFVTNVAVSTAPACNVKVIAGF